MNEFDVLVKLWAEKKITNTERDVGFKILKRMANEDRKCDWECAISGDREKMAQRVADVRFNAAMARYDWARFLESAGQRAELAQSENKANESAVVNKLDRILLDYDLMPNSRDGLIDDLLEKFDIKLK